VHIEIVPVNRSPEFIQSGGQCVVILVLVCSAYIGKFCSLSLNTD